MFWWINRKSTQVYTIERFYFVEIWHLASIPLLERRSTMSRDDSEYVEYKWDKSFDVRLPRSGRILCIFTAYARKSHGEIFPTVWHHSSKDVWHVHSQPKVWFDHNFSTSRYDKNLKKITHIKDVKNIYFVQYWGRKVIDKLVGGRGERLRPSDVSSPVFGVFTKIDEIRTLAEKFTAKFLNISIVKI